MKWKVFCQQRPMGCGRLIDSAHQLPASSFVRLGAETFYANVLAGMILSTATKRITTSTSSMSTTSTTTKSIKTASGAWRNS
jgi:hypothetical protein